MRYLYIFSILSISYTLSAGYEDEVYKSQDQLRIGATTASRQKLIQEAEECYKASISLELQTSDQWLKKKCINQQSFVKAYIQILEDTTNSPQLEEATEKRFIALGKIILFNDQEFNSLINQENAIFKQTSILQALAIKVENGHGGNNPLQLLDSSQYTPLLWADTKNPYIEYRKKRPSSDYSNSQTHLLPQTTSTVKISNKPTSKATLPSPKYQIKWHHLERNFIDNRKFIDNQYSFQIEPGNKKRKFSEISKSQSSHADPANLKKGFNHYLKFSLEK